MPKTPRGTRKRWTKERIGVLVASISAVGTVAAAGLTGLFGLLSDETRSPRGVANTGRGESKSSNRGDTCVGGNDISIEGSTINCARQPSPSRAPQAVTADAGCGSPTGREGRRALKMRVLMWCAPKAVRGQYQFKLKVAVKNTGKVALDIGVERFLLVWKSLDRTQWSPPRINPAGAKARPPFRIRYGGRDFWGVPPNPDGAYDDVPGGSTFATHWRHRSLDPGERSLRLTSSSETIKLLKEDGTAIAIRFNKKHDDLVFYVPASAVNAANNFVGLAYYDGRKILAFCPQDRWGPKVPPNYWTNL